MQKHRLARESDISSLYQPIGPSLECVKCSPCTAVVVVAAGEHSANASADLEADSTRCDVLKCELASRKLDERVVEEVVSHEKTPHAPSRHHGGFSRPWKANPQGETSAQKPLEPGSAAPNRKIVRHVCSEDRPRFDRFTRAGKLKTHGGVFYTLIDMGNRAS